MSTRPKNFRWAITGSPCVRTYSMTTRIVSSVNHSRDIGAFPSRHQLDPVTSITHNSDKERKILANYSTSIRNRMASSKFFSLASLIVVALIGSMVQPMAALTATRSRGKATTRLNAWSLPNPMTHSKSIGMFKPAWYDDHHPTARKVTYDDEYVYRLTAEVLRRVVFIPTNQLISNSYPFLILQL